MEYNDNVDNQNLKYLDFTQSILPRIGICLGFVWKYSVMYCTWDCNGTGERCFRITWKVILEYAMYNVKIQGILF